MDRVAIHVLAKKISERRCLNCYRISELWECSPGGYIRTTMDEAGGRWLTWVPDTLPSDILGCNCPSSHHGILPPGEKSQSTAAGGVK